jgi:hypothetical protein
MITGQLIGLIVASFHVLLLCIVEVCARADMPAWPHGGAFGRSIRSTAGVRGLGCDVPAIAAAQPRGSTWLTMTGDNRDI